MSIDDLLLRDWELSGIARLVLVDVVWQKLSPGVVSHTGRVPVSGGYSTSMDGSDVMALAVVVPGEDLPKG